MWNNTYHPFIYPAQVWKENRKGEAQLYSFINAILIKDSKVVFE